LRASKLRQVSAVFEQKSYTDGQYIVKEGAPGTDFYVIWNGTVRVTKTTSEKGIVHLCDIHGGDFFGEMALLTNGLRTASCIALGDVICFTISQSSFTRMVGDDLLPAMQLEASNRIAFANKTLQDAHLKLLDDMKLGDLSLVRPIGKGGFGFVQLVKYAADGSMYALKQINKRRAFSDETSVEKIIGEKNALFDIRHPFTVRPVKTFVDENNMYVLMELIEAGELYQVIQNKKNKTRNRDTALMAPQARFYAACVISVLSYMHQRRYIYRDLKPENLMIDLQGYIKVIDFGLVKRHLQGHTYTFCGTPEYLAPEIVCGKGYSFGVDWWALGVLIYEMLVGFTPFRGENAEGIMQTILTGEFQFPASLKDDQARDLISSLLCTDPAKRLGTQRNGGAEIKAHKWFSAVNWRGILDRHVKAPWAPKFKEANFADVNSIEASADLPCPSNWKNEWDESWLNIAWQHQMWSSMSGSEGMGDGEEGCSVGDEQGSRKAQEEF
jgi:cGMP-dependent protein kinase